MCIYMGLLSSVSTKQQAAKTKQECTTKADSPPVLDPDPRQGILLISRKQQIHTVLGGTLKYPPTPGMIAFAEALKSPMGSMGKLDYLQLDGNKIGDEGMVAFSAAISSGSLASLTSLVVNDKEHPQLKAACHQRGIRVHDLAAWHQGA